MQRWKNIALVSGLSVSAFAALMCLSQISGEMRAKRFENNLRIGMSWNAVLHIAQHEGGKTQRDIPMLNLDQAKPLLNARYESVSYAPVKDGMVSLLSYTDETRNTISAHSKEPGRIVEFLSFDRIPHQTNVFSQKGVGYFLIFDHNGHLLHWRHGTWQGGLVCICI